jgi:hypothetical protein
VPLRVTVRSPAGIEAAPEVTGSIDVRHPDRVSRFTAPVVFSFETVGAYTITAEVGPYSESQTVDCKLLTEKGE